MDYDESDSRPRAAARPDSLKKLRACRTCHLIKTYEQFHSGFCENCPSERPEGGGSGVRSDWVDEHTTADFEGMVSMMQPGVSWVSRWLKMRFSDGEGRVVPHLPGIYAIALPGEEMKRREEQAGSGVGGEEDQYEEEEEEEEVEEEGAGAAAPRKGAAGARAAAAVDTNDPAEREEAVAGAVVAEDDGDD